MSILRPIIRACAVAALRDKTWAGTKVYDSNITPLADAVQGQVQAPYIVVFTDADDRIANPGAEMYRGDTRQLSLTIEMGIASAVTVQGQVVIHFANTDEAHELAVDVLDGQIKAALFGDPYSQWGELFRRIVYHVKRVPSRRGGQAQGGIRFAARRTTYICDTLDDLPPGETPDDGTPIMDFIAMASQHPDAGIQSMGQVIAALVSGDPNPAWRVNQSMMGMQRKSIEALNVPGTLLPDPTIEEPPLDYSDTNEWAPPLTDVALADADPTTTVPLWPPDDYFDPFKNEHIILIPVHASPRQIY